MGNTHRGTWGDGSLGSDYIDDTVPHSVDLNFENVDGTPAAYVYHQGFKYWKRLVAAENTIFAVLTYHTDHAGDGYAIADTLEAGEEISGKFSVIDLTSGAITAYR